MSEYKGIKGFQVQTRTEDPSDGVAGDFYYNSTTGQFKTIGAGVGTWASGTSIPQNRSLYATSGTRDTAYIFGGAPQSAISTGTILYNGTSWTETHDTNRTASSAGGFGTSTLAVMVNGYMGGNPAPTYYPTQAEEYNGSAWTEVNNTPEVSTECGSAGSQTAGLIFGGYNPAGSPNYIANTKTYDGTNWTEVNNVNTARNRSMGYAIGIQTSALFAGGDSGSITGATESWNGTSWTETTDINTARSLSAGSGSQTSAVVAGGRQSTNRYTNTELWDGSSWTEVNDLSTSRSYNVGSGTGDGSSANNTQQMYAGGVTGPSSTANTTATEEWNIPDFEIKTVTTS